MVKGYLYTLEVMVAVSIIFVAFMFVYRTPPTIPETSLTLIKQQGYYALKNLDESGELRMFADESDYASIKQRLNIMLPKTVYYDFDICSSSCYMYNIPVNRTITTVQYYISGYKDHYEGKKIMLWMWGRY